MGTRPGRTRPSVASYAEIESDVDVSDSDRPESATKAPSKKVSKRKKKKVEDAPVPAPAVEENPEPPSLELFLNMPLDILAEICTHLEQKDLLELARSARIFRALLLSRAGRSIWAAARLAEELPLPKGMSEVQLAVFMEGRACCDCGVTTFRDASPDPVFQARRCYVCRRLALVRRKDVPKKVSRPHPSLLKCCVSADDDLYELAELVVLNAELWERQEEDDAAEAQHQTTRLKAGTKSRRIVIPDAVPTTPPTSLVETFVEEKALLVSERQKEAAELSAAIQIGRQRACQRQWALHVKEGERLNELQAARHISLVAKARIKMASIGWSVAEFDDVEADALRSFAPYGSSPPLTDQEWVRLEVKVVGAFKRARDALARKVAQAAAQARRMLLKPYYDDFKADYDADLSLPFPHFDTFCSLPSVTSFWTPTNSTVNLASWRKRRSSIFAELQDAEKDLEQHAADVISTATSSHAPQLDELATDDQLAFFSRVTSLFVNYPRRPAELIPFPEILFRSGYYRSTGKLWNVDKGTRANSVLVFRAILEAAGLDDTATTDELDRASGRFCWGENPGGHTRTRYRWRKLAVRILATNFSRKDLAKPTITMVEAALKDAGTDDDEELEDSDDGGGNDASLTDDRNCDRDGDEVLDEEEESDDE